MSFIGETTVLPIKTPQGKEFRMFLTEQEGGYWVATVLYASPDHLVTTEVKTATEMMEAWRKAAEWCHNNIDANVEIPMPG